MGVDSANELVQARILSYFGRYFRIGQSLSMEDQVEILLSLVQNLDMFAWSPYKVLGVDPNFIMHRLNVDPLTPPKVEA